MTRDRGRDICRLVWAPPPRGVARVRGRGSRGAPAGAGPWPRGAASACPACPPSCRGWGWAGRLCSSCQDWAVSALDWLWAGGGCGEASCWSLRSALGRLSALALLTLVRLLRLLGLCRLGRAPLTFHFLAGDRRGLGPPPTCPL